MSSSIKEIAPNATTAEIDSNVAQAAQGSGDIARNIGGVAKVAQSTAAGSTETQKASSELSRMAIEMETIVSRFKF